jgi:hypothetical protein
MSDRWSISAIFRNERAGKRSKMARWCATDD